MSEQNLNNMVLSDAEIMDMLVAFYSEALEFLKVPRELWAEVKMGVSINGTDKKANIFTINYEKKRILVCLPVLRLMIAISHRFFSTHEVLLNTSILSRQQIQQYLCEY